MVPDKKLFELGHFATLLRAAVGTGTVQMWWKVAGKELGFDPATIEPADDPSRVWAVPTEKKENPDKTV